MQLYAPRRNSLFVVFVLYQLPVDCREHLGLSDHICFILDVKIDRSEVEGEISDFFIIRLMELILECCQKLGVHFSYKGTHVFGHLVEALLFH